jgi:uncharacterized protein YjbI with pentapeptide repeats
MTNLLPPSRHVENGPSIPAPRPSIPNPEAWKAYWRTCNQPWRTEPEISLHRQAELSAWRNRDSPGRSEVDSSQRVKLSRADIEWLLSTHRHGAGPIDWQDEEQLQMEGLDLRGADVSDGINLRGLPLTRLVGGFAREERIDKSVVRSNLAATAYLEKADFFEAHLEGARLAGAHMAEADFRLASLRGADLRAGNLSKANLTGANVVGANFTNAQLQEAYLTGAQLEGAKFYGADLRSAVLFGAQLEGAYLVKASLVGANLSGAQLKGADLRGAQLQGADLSGAWLEDADLTGAQLAGANLVGAHFTGARLTGVSWSDRQYRGPRVLDVQWGTANLGAARWSEVAIVDDERQGQGQQTDQAAIRAYRQLALALQAQGLSEDAARFLYRAQVLQRGVLRKQLRQRLPGRSRLQKIGAYLFSGFLDLIAGYGQKPGRSFLAFVLIIALGAIASAFLVPLPLFPDATLFSFSVFLGRGLFAPSLHMRTPLAVLVVLEACVGLVLQITWIAIFTQRLLKK